MEPGTWWNVSSGHLSPSVPGPELDRVQTTTPNKALNLGLLSLNMSRNQLNPGQ